MAKQSEKKLQRLMEKSKELFFNNGYKKVSVDEIANEAGISKMTIYKYYPSKEDLYIAAIIDYSEYHLQIVKNEIEGIYHTIDKIKYLYEYAMAANKDISTDLYRDIFDRPYIMEKLLEYKQDASYKLWMEILQDGVQKGEIRKINVEFVAKLLMQMPSFLAKSEEILAENGLQTLMENLFDFMKYGLLGGMDSP